MKTQAKAPSEGACGTITVALLRPLALLIVCMGTAVACFLAPEASMGETAGVVMELPETVLGMESEHKPASDAEKEILPPDTQFEGRTYTAPDGAWLNANIVLSGEDRNSIHRPEICLPGQGWTIKSRQIRDIEIPGKGMLAVTDLGLERQMEGGDGETKLLRAHYYYWFVGKGVSTPSHITRVLVTSLDNVFENLNHRWAYVSLMAPIPASFTEGARDEETTLELMDHFVAASTGSFQQAYGCNRWWLAPFPLR